jgi:hypothetical protein
LLVGLAVLAAGIALLVFAIRQAGLTQIVDSVRSVGLWLAPIVVLGGARMAIRATAWHVCSRAEHAEGIPISAACEAVIAADAVGNLTPLGLLASEPTKVIFARRHVSTAASLSSVTVENGFYTASVLAMLLGGVWVLLQRAQVPSSLARAGEVVIATSVAAGLVAVWAFRTRPALLSRGGQWLASLFGRPGSAAAFDALERSVYDVVHWPASRLCAVVTLEVAFHLLAIVEVWLILRVMPGGGGTSITDAFLMETTGRFITVAFKFVPYRLGIDEMGSGSVAQLIGLGASAGVALALVRRVRILILNLVGILVLARARRPR